MPLYEYECNSCGVRFERLQHMDEEPVKICPECGGDVHRLIQPVGIIFKGSGFYVTDHRSGSRARNSASATATANKATEASKKVVQSSTASANKSAD